MVERKWPEGIYVRELPMIEGKIYSQVTCGDGKNIHIAGTLPFDADQNFVGENDVRLQTRCIMEHIGRSLAAFGAGPADVVRTKTYVTDMKDFLENGLQEWVSFFAGEPPTSTTVGVTELADERATVEIEAYAVIPD